MKKNLLFFIMLFLSALTFRNDVLFSQFEKNNYYPSLIENPKEVDDSSRGINNGKSQRSFIDSLIAIMTIEEKIGQLTEVVAFHPISEEDIRTGRVSSVLGIKNDSLATKYQRIAVEESRLGIPLLYTNDVIHGYETTFPIPLAEASSWNLDLIEKVSAIAAFEAAEEGTHLTFAPMIDIARDPRWGRIAEGAGEDPFLGSEIATARVKGFQGNLGEAGSIGACAKHFVAYGAAEGGKDYNTTEVSERTLREIYLPPFKAAVDAGVVSIMSAFNDLNGIPATGNRFILTDILRTEWKFDGFVISDYNSIGEMINHRFAKNKSEAALKAITAGVDMDMNGGDILGNIYTPSLAKLLADGKLKMSVVDKAVKRVLRIKERLGLFDRPFPLKSEFCKIRPTDAEKKSLARRIAQESIVLLKNENKVLPLKKEIGSIAVIGELAINPHHSLGPWNCKPVPENVVTPIQGIIKAVDPETRVSYVKGYSADGTDTTGFSEALKICALSEVIIMFVGETGEMSGEAACRTDISLPGMQKELVKRIKELNKTLVLVLMNGRPLAINWAADNVPTIVESWFLGDQAGNALADILFGDCNPSGKLTVSFPRNEGQIPLYYNHKSTGRPYNENNKYTAKYLDAPVTPLYPFGFGLSYTEFRYTDLKIDTLSSENNKYIVSVDIENIGEYDGYEIAQLYIRDEYASITRPVKELKGFKKVFIPQKEKITLRFEIGFDELSFPDKNYKRVLEPGLFTIMIGTSSEKYIERKLVIEE